MSNVKYAAGRTRPPRAELILGEKSLDNEMRELVLKFEQVSAGIGPQVEGEKRTRSDDILPDFSGVQFHHAIPPAVTPRRAEPQRSAAKPNWSTRSRRFSSIALIAGIVGLALGTGVGYMMARGHDTASVAKIRTLPEGGTKLRVDYDLRRR